MKIIRAVANVIIVILMFVAVFSIVCFIGYSLKRFGIPVELQFVAVIAMGIIRQLWD